MTGFRQKLLESPARYRCVICGKRLVEFHLCPGCLQPVHPGCVCHPLTEQQGNGMHSSVANRSCLPHYEEEM